MEPFHKHFGTALDGSSTGLIFSIYAVGQLVGALFGAPACDTFGRRVGMFLGSLFVVLGVIIEVTALGVNQFVGGRFLIGFGVTISTIVGPIYLVEMAPPHWRGLFGGLSNAVGYYVGGLGTQSLLPVTESFVPASLTVITTSMYLERLWHWLPHIQLVLEDPNPHSVISIYDHINSCFLYPRKS